MLELRKITKRFGEVLANDAVDIVVSRGTIHAVIGENGAGKSTAMRIAYGFYRPDSGEIVIDGEPVRLATPHDAIARGVGMVHQHFTLVEPMTVAENIILGAEGSTIGLDIRKAAERIANLSRDFRLDVDPYARIEDLSVGQQQRVELLKALYREARLLILDEPTAVLTPQEVDEFFTILRGMRGQNKTVVIITHKLAEVMAISDEVTVMRDGRVVGRRKTSETNPAELARLMVGRDVLLRVEKVPARTGSTVLEVHNLSVRGAGGKQRVEQVSFDVKAGEIVGIAGVEGNGQTELVDAISGLLPPERVSGEVLVNGHSVERLSARRRRELGVAHVPEDRHRRGLVLELDLQENAVLGVHHRPPISRAATLNRAAIRDRTEEILQNFDVRPPRPELPARALSGGNQQKLILGRELFQRPRLLIVSQPTRGVDIGAIEFIYRKLLDLRERGCAILLISAELEEVTALSDRLLVIHAGEIVAELDPRRASTSEIGLLMAGGRSAA